MKDKKDKIKKEKMPTIWKFMWSKQFMIAVLILLVGISTLVGTQFLFKSDTNFLIIFGCWALVILLFLSFAVLMIFSIFGANRKRGKVIFLEL